MTATEYLKYLQDTEATHDEPDWTIESFGERNRLWEDTRKWWDDCSEIEKKEIIENVNNPLSKINNPTVMYRHLFERNIPADEASLVRNIVVGELCTFDPNAWTLLAPDDTPIIVVHKGMKGFIDDITRLYIAYYAHIAEDERYKDYDLDRLAIYAYLSFIHFATNGRVNELASHVPVYSDALLGQQWRLTTALHNFTLAHEYGHCVLGHNRSITRYALPKNREQFLRLAIRGQQDEYDADQWAMRAIELMMSEEGDISNPWKFSRVAPIILFHACEYLYALTHSEVGKHDLSLDLIRERRNRIEYYIEPEATEIENAYIEIAHRIFSNAKKRLRKIRKSKLSDIAMHLDAETLERIGKLSNIKSW